MYVLFAGFPKGRSLVRSQSVRAKEFAPSPVVRCLNAKTLSLPELTAQSDDENYATIQFERRRAHCFGRENRWAEDKHQNPYFACRILNASSPPSIIRLIASLVSGTSIAPSATILPPEASPATR